MRLLGLVLVAWVLSACATGPADPSLDAEAKLFRTLADKACIYVVASNSTVAVTGTMDGRNVATLNAANCLRLDVPPGRHVLAVTPASLLPVFLRETPDTVPVEAEAGHCDFLRTLWREDERGWRLFRVDLGRGTAAEGQRAIDIRTVILPVKSQEYSTVWGLEQTRILAEAKRKDARARLEANLTHALAQVQAIRERRTGPGPLPTAGRSGSWSRHPSADE